MGFFKSVQTAVNRVVPPAVVKAVAAVVPTPVAKAVAVVARQTTANVGTLSSAVNHAGSAVNNEVHKPEFIAGLQATTKIGLGVVELGLGFVPGGALANKAINTSLAAGNSKNGQVGAWTGVGNSNSTLNMVPGGLLAQNIAGVATNGRSNQEMNRFVPDPKKAVIGGLIGAVKNPSQITNSTLSGINSIGSVVSSTRPSIGAFLSKTDISTPVNTLDIMQVATSAPKPSLRNSFGGPPSMGMPFRTKSSTISLPDTGIEPAAQEKVSFMEAVLTPDQDSNPRPPPMSTLGNVALQRAVGTTDTVSSPSNMSTSAMLPFVALACVVVLVVMR